jgi:hypothetical protein
MYKCAKSHVFQERAGFNVVLNAVSNAKEQGKGNLVALIHRSVRASLRVNTMRYRCHIASCNVLRSLPRHLSHIPA